MQSGFLHFKRSIIHYLKAGSGNEILLCFHGYGESAQHFSFLAANLKEAHTIIAPDLPFHGETVWNEKELDPANLIQVLQQVLIHEKIEDKKIVLIGYSMGARIALTAYQQLPEKFSKLVLLAPDGLKLNFWYWLSTQTFIGNKLFKWTMEHPSLFFSFLKIANKLRIINQSIYKFVSYYIHDSEVRKELYDRWTCMRKCSPNLDIICGYINKEQVPVHLLYGRYDRIIVTGPATRFVKRLHQNASITILDCGHQVLNSKNADVIAKAIIN